HYRLQGWSAAGRAQAVVQDQTDGAQIVSLYDALSAVAPSPIVSLNRAVAVGMASGPQAGLDALDALGDEAALRHYHLFPSVRGHLLARAGRRVEARGEFEGGTAPTP